MNVLIRPWRLGDREGLVLAANHEKVGRTLRDGFPFPYTKEEAEKWINLQLLCYPPTQFAIFSEGTLVGGIGFIHKDNIYSNRAEIGYWLGEPYWNQGIGTRAVGLLVDRIFARPGIEHLFAEVFSNNPASIRILEKNGFLRDATIQKTIEKEGILLDIYIYVNSVNNNQNILP
jgi:RimJ/RimL family protein N-acetyltransferase